MYIYYYNMCIHLKEITFHYTTSQIIKTLNVFIKVILPHFHECDMFSFINEKCILIGSFHLFEFMLLNIQ